MTFIYLSIALLLSIVFVLTYVNYQETRRVRELLQVGIKANIKEEDLFVVAVQVWRTEKKIKEYFKDTENIPETIKASLERQKRWLLTKGVEIKDYTSMPAHGLKLDVANIDYDKKIEKAYISEMVEPEILYFGKIAVKGKVKVIQPRERKTFKVYLEGLSNTTEPIIIEVKEETEKDTILTQETLEKSLKSREGYLFDFWLDKTVKEKAKFPYKIQSDTFLVAQWKQIESPIILPVLETTIQYFRDDQGKEPYQSVLIRANEIHEVVTFPDPVRESLFLGWFKVGSDQKISTIKADGETHLLYPKYKESTDKEELNLEKETANALEMEEKEENQNESKN